MELRVSQGVSPGTQPPRKPASPPLEGLASWYTPGLVDGFGDRLLMFDNADSGPLEVLRFHAKLAATPGFEEMLLDRIRQVSRLTHPAFPTVRTVERLETDRSLALVSTHTPGKRLSTFFAEPWRRRGLQPAFVAGVVTQVIESLSVLQSQGKSVAHGALTADRVILTPEARVCVSEHVLGSALEQLRLSPAQLWREFGILIPRDPVPREPVGAPRLDARGDVFQIGVLALSLLLARRLTPADIEERLPDLLDHWSESAAARSSLCGEMLRRWLERALQVGERPYGSAAEAYPDLRDMPSEPTSAAFDYLQAGDSDGPARPLMRILPTAQTNGLGRHAPNDSSIAAIRDEGVSRTRAATTGAENRIVEARGAFPLERVSPPLERLSPRPGSRLFDDSALEQKRLPPPASSNNGRARSWITASLATLALTEALIIAVMMIRPAGSFTTTVAPSPRAAEVRSTPEVPAAAASPTDLESAIVQAVGDVNKAARPEAALDVSRPTETPTAVAIARAAGTQRSGGVRLSSPIELKVLQGDRVLGSSADGPVVMAAGTYELDLINTALGFRAHQSVTFRAGQITTLTIPVPRGRISVNAQPWAEVWIDDRLVGETPLANLDLPIGEHQVMFRHPQLGERRQTLVVRADTPARISETFDR